MKKCKECGQEVEEESLEKKFRHSRTFLTDKSCNDLSLIATNYFKAHPEEIGYVSFERYKEQLEKKTLKDYVSKERVLEVFDKATNSWDQEQVNVYDVFKSIRKALEKEFENGKDNIR